MNTDTRNLLISLAQRYETEDFLIGDPSCYMHKVEGKLNQETVAFVAANLSYGSRKQFMQKIDYLMFISNGDMYSWIKDSAFEKEFLPDDKSCFYRLYSKGEMYKFFSIYSRLLSDYESLSAYLKSRGVSTAYDAINEICIYFDGKTKVVPKDTKSPCKRLSMFLRWMVRTGSPVDLGLWHDFIGEDSLIIPLDTHVMQQAVRLHLIPKSTASMTTAVRLTEQLKDVFPHDPVKADFALFGYGVNN